MDARRLGRAHCGVDDRPARALPLAALDLSFVPDLERWDAWDPHETAARLTGVREPWCVVAGWAIDLFLGRRTRDHADLEIAVGPKGFDEVRRALADYELVVVGGGLAYPFSEEALAVHHQTWVRERETEAWRLDVFREPWDGDTWVFRRDPRVRRPLADAIDRTADGTPYLRPELVLLFKAKAVREKDEADLAAVLPELEPSRRRWLTNALELTQPGHAWLATLQD